MELVICGSVSFASKKQEYKEKLEEKGYEVSMDRYTERIAEGDQELSRRVREDHAEVKREYDLIRMYFNSISDSDGVFIVNLDKNGVENYIGANTFLEIGYAHALDKNIYLLNPLPDQEYIKDELKAMDTTVLNGDLGKIRDSGGR